MAPWPTRSPSAPGPAAREPRFPDGLPEIWNLPPRNPGFIARVKELERIWVSLAAETMTTGQAMHGMGGVGKTQTAIEYAYRQASHYDMVWWIDAEEPTLIPGHFVTLGAELSGRNYDRARTDLAYGELLRRTQRRSAARPHLRAALAIFEELAAEPLLSRAEEELRASGETARKRDPSTLTLLTPMELQVAQLVARGMSNKDAAARCWISPRTVAFHLRNVFSKTGVSSRGELAQLGLATPVRSRCERGGQVALDAVRLAKAERPSVDGALTPPNPTPIAANGGGIGDTVRAGDHPGQHRHHPSWPGPRHHCPSHQ